MTAVMFGRGVDDAFSNLLDALELGPEDVLEEGVEAEDLDYVCVLNDSMVGET
jgi:predicted RNase H-like HicB family nuclease